ncbi:hypothetical protein ACN28C_21940 [Plantactinospora sp. WMMC1484]|uniref:hypothetical protein n=1 Tax=Plantactinospora sp. WMMC1484 TaxID=3404122 RepID=UPI003BF57BE5
MRMLVLADPVTALCHAVAPADDLQSTAGRQRSARGAAATVIGPAGKPWHGDNIAR